MYCPKWVDSHFLFVHIGFFLNMKKLPKISSEIDEKSIHKVIVKNYSDIAPFFFSFMSNWLIRSYQRYNDVDKFIIIIYLIHQNLIV